VKDHATCVDDVAQFRRQRSPKAGAYDLSSFGIVDRGVSSFRGHLRAQGLDHPRVPELFDELGIGRLVDQRAYGGQG
jgi:hypothetical protein